MKKINFENLPSTNTPINAENLNKIQENVEKEFLDKEGVILYENTSGTYTTATLNDDISNYTKVVIIWVSNQYVDALGRKTTVDYDFKPNTLYTFDSTFWSDSNKQIYSTVTGYKINGTTLTISINQGGTVGGNTAYTASANVMKCVKIIGYK